MDYSESEPKTFFSDLKFLLKFNSVIIKELPLLLWSKIKEMDFDNDVIVLSDLKTRAGYTIEITGYSNPSETHVFAKKTVQRVISSWFYYWKLKGVLSNNIEPSLHKLSWTSRL